MVLRKVNATTTITANYKVRLDQLSFTVQWLIDGSAKNNEHQKQLDGKDTEVMNIEPSCQEKMSSCRLRLKFQNTLRAK